MVPVMGERDLKLSAASIGLLSGTEGLGGAVAPMIIGLKANNRSLFPLYYWGPFFYLIFVAALALHLSIGITAITFIAGGATAACFSAAQGLTVMAFLGIVLWFATDRSRVA